VREAARSVNNARCSSLNTSGARCVVLAMCLTVTTSGVVMAMMIIYFCKYFNETNYYEFERVKQVEHDSGLLTGA
jgi:hypothetical protein